MPLSVKRICFVLLVLLVSSCRKHDSTAAIPSGFSVQINGVQWVPATAKASSLYISPCASCPLGTGLMFQAADSSDKSLYIALDGWNGRAGTFGDYPHGVGPGIYIDYNLCKSCDTSVHAECNNASGPYGKLVITALSTTNIQGTFTGTIVNGKGDSVAVSGEFNLPLNQ